MKSNLQHFLVHPSDGAATLQEFLAVQLKLSKGKAKALLDQRVVFVNGRRVWMARHELHAGDEVEVQTPAGHDPAAAARPPDTLYEDDDYLVVLSGAQLLLEPLKEFVRSLATSDTSSGLYASGRPASL